ncbi:hypothetical protein D3C85_1173120 [compost metagenome]
MQVNLGITAVQKSTGRQAALHQFKFEHVDEMVHQAIAKGYQFTEARDQLAVVFRGERDAHLHPKPDLPIVWRLPFSLDLGLSIRRASAQIAATQCRHQAAQCLVGECSLALLANVLKLCRRSLDLEVRGQHLHHLFVLLQAQHAAPEFALNVLLQCTHRVWCGRWRQLRHLLALHLHQSLDDFLFEGQTLHRQRRGVKARAALPDVWHCGSSEPLDCLPRPHRPIFCARHALPGICRFLTR